MRLDIIWEHGIISVTKDGCGKCEPPWAVSREATNKDISRDDLPRKRDSDSQRQIIKK